MFRYRHHSSVIGLFALALAACPSAETTPESAATDAGAETPTSPSQMGSGGKSGAGGRAGSGGRQPAGSGGSTPSAGAGSSAAGSAAHSGDDPDQDAGISDQTCPPKLAVPAICKLCDDGSCGTPVCKNGALTGEYRCPAQKPTKPASRDCVVGGCSSQLCTDSDTGPVVSTCEWREEYACYRDATCEQQPNGKCGWTSTPELDKCLQAAGARP